MPETIDWPPPRTPRPSPSPRRRIRLILILLFVVLAVVFGGRVASTYYVDALWFGSLGYQDVFWKTLGVQSGVFAAFAAVTFLVLYGSFLALKRAHLDDLPSSHTIFVGGQPVRLPVDSILHPLALALSLIIAVMTGAGMMAEWPTLALYWYAPHTLGSIADPIFGRPLNFFCSPCPLGNSSPAG